MIYSLGLLAIGLLFAGIYCLSEKKFFEAMILAIFLSTVLLMQNKYKQHITVESFELLENALHITYKNQRQVSIPYAEINELRHYCRKAETGCGVNVYSQQGKVELRSFRSNSDDAKQLKAEIYQKMHK